MNKKELLNELIDNKRFIKNGVVSITIYEKELNYLIKLLKESELKNV